MTFDFKPQRGSGLEEQLNGFHLSKDCLNLLKSLLIYNPSERISAIEALNHAYFKEIYEIEKPLM